jgi:hypothetical protein
VNGLIPSKETNQFPNADHFLTVIGEAWLRRNKPPNDGNKAFELNVVQYGNTEQRG